MKKVLLFILVLFATGSLFAQTDGMSYQAVILNPTTQEIPGADVSGNIFPNKSLSVRFTIINSTGNAIYQEVHNTKTDAYGMINLIIGHGSFPTGNFTEIIWDGSRKDLKVEINLDGNYNLLSNQMLLFLPYAYHRDVIASGDLTVAGDVSFSGDLVVDGTTNLNKSLSVNNGSASKLTGTLDVDGVTTLGRSLTVANQSATNLSGTITVDGVSKLKKTLEVDGATTLNNSLTVRGQNPTALTGTLKVDGITNLNNALNVTNGSPTTLTGSLNVTGAIGFTGDLIVDGTSRLNNSLTVANATPTTLTGTFGVIGASDLKNTLNVDGATDLNSTLTVDGVSDLKNTLNVDGTTDLNSTLTVDGASDLKNKLNVDGATDLNNTLKVTGATDLKNILNVDGVTNLNSTLTVDGTTLINNSLTVTGIAMLNDLDIKTLDIKSDNANFVATFENLNADNGDGLLIKLGRTHGAWNGGSYLNIQNPVLLAFNGPLNTVKGWLNGGDFTPSQLFDLMPSQFIAGAMAQIGNGIIGSINSGLNLPIGTPAIVMPQLQILGPVDIFPGISMPSPIPDIPSITTPNIAIPSFTILPAITNLIPAIPTIPTGGLPQLSIPNFTCSVVNNSLSKENEYITFQDKAGRTTGTISAQSTKDFRDSTVLDNVYLFNVMSSFVGIDLLDGVTSGIVEISNLVNNFNKIGVEYSSGNGDYAEWLERVDVSEYLTVGDIIGVKGGKITKDLTNVEQIMVVSHKPIVLGNIPEQEHTYKGNNIAFMGQVPVKVIGAVQTGDYIVASSEIKGYGVAIHPENMTAIDFTLAVGRSWENRVAEGPKMVNTVVGVQNGDWKLQVSKIQKQQQKLDEKIESLDVKLHRIAENIKIAKLNKTNYVIKN